MFEMKNYQYRDRCESNHWNYKKTMKITKINVEI